MSNMEIKAAEMIIAPKEESSRTFLDTFIFEPENIEEQNLGNLYIAGEITKVTSNSEYLINLLVATIKKEYYSLSSRSPINGLEQSLSKTNEMLADFAEQGNIQWIGNLHIVIAVLKDGALYFSQTGAAQTLLIREKSVVNIGQDLVAEQKPHPLKTFSNIASGKIDIGDKVILATSGLKNIAGKEKIKNIFGAGADEEFAQKIESGLGSQINVAIILLEAKEKKFASGINFVQIPSDPGREMEFAENPDLRQTPKYSPKYPGDRDRVEEVIDELNSQELKIPISHKIKKAAKATRFVVENIKKILLIIYKAAVRFYLFLKPRIIIAISSLLLKLKIFTEKISVKAKSVSVVASGLEKTENVKNIAAEKIDRIMPQFIKNISLKNKIIAVSAIIIVVAASVSASAYIKKSEEEKNIRYYSNLLDSAKKSQKDAEVADIYQDKDKTINIIRTALATSEKIIQSGYFLNEAKSVKESVLKQMDKIEGVERIEEPVKIIDFAAQSKSIRTDGIALLSKKLYSFNSENNAIYKYDFAKKTSEIMAVNSKDVGHLKLSKVTADRIIFLTDLPGTASYEPAKSDIKKLSIKFAADEKDMADMEIYKQNSSLYILSKNDNEIYKHSLIAAGFADGKKWLKENDTYPLINPVSLTIDSDIYVLQNDSNNPIVKFTKGYKKEFNSPPLLMPLKEAAKIITDSGAKNLYILDPKNKRVVVIGKTGKLIKQFISEKFDNLKDITISPKEKEIYLLNGTSVYEIAL